MIKLTVRGLPSDEVTALRAGGADANGQPALVRIAEGVANPCRHCLGLTSGIHNYTSDSSYLVDSLSHREYTPRELLDISFGKEPSFVPGEAGTWESDRNRSDHRGSSAGSTIRGAGDAVSLGASAGNEGADSSAVGSTVGVGCGVETDRGVDAFLVAPRRERRRRVRSSSVAPPGLPWPGTTSAALG